MYLCANCFCRSKAFKNYCQKCGGTNTFMALEKLRARGVPLPLSYAHDEGGDQTIKTGLTALDEVTSLNGGFAVGGIYVLSGDPGAGKSTCSIQVAAHIAKKHRVVYVSTEERQGTLKARAKRLGLEDNRILSVQVQSTEELLEKTGGAKFVILDSLQGMRDRCGLSVEDIAKAVTARGHETNTTWLLINHIIKTGEAAGAETLQHDVDATLHMTTTGNTGAVRSLVSPKNRFGPANTPVFLRMTGTGLLDIPDATSYMLADRVADEPGSVVAAAVFPDAQTALLVEVQAMTVIVGEKEKPQVTAVGYPGARLRIIMGILAQRAHVDLFGYHVSVSISGGMKIDDPGLDLAVALALASSQRGVPVDPRLCVWGELGLVGEIRTSRENEARERETKRAGFKPLGQCRRLKDAIGVAGLGVVAPPAPVATAVEETDVDVPVSAPVARGKLRTNGKTPGGVRGRAPRVSEGVPAGGRSRGKTERVLVEEKGRVCRAAHGAGAKKKGGAVA